MNFRKFTDQAERLEKGLIAYDRAVDFDRARLVKITRTRLKILPGSARLLPVVFGKQQLSGYGP